MTLLRQINSQLWVLFEDYSYTVQGPSMTVLYDYELYTIELVTWRRSKLYKVFVFDKS